jgi:hypothetical protein
VIDETEPEAESDLRRRAAWLFAMLALVVVLVVVILTKVVGGNGGSHQSHNGPAPLDSYVNGQTGRSTSSTAHQQSSPDSGTGSSSAGGGSSSSSTGSGSSPPAGGAASCPSSKTCVLDGDVGNGIDAINAYRTAHGQSAVDGSVTPKAQTCAQHNGNGCTGGWAETELSKPDGEKAVTKILKYGKLLDPKLKDFEVGWAYDPGAKMYYFAIVRND